MILTLSNIAWWWHSKIFQIWGR